MTHIGQEFALGAVCGLGAVARGGHGGGALLLLGDVSQHGHTAAVGGAEGLVTYPAPVRQMEFRLRPGGARIEFGHPAPGAVGQLGEPPRGAGGLDVAKPLLARLDAQAAVRQQLGVGAVPDLQPVGRIEEGQARRRRVQRMAHAGEGVVLAEPLYEHQAGRRQEDKAGQRAGSQRQTAAANRLGRQGEAGIGDQADRGHGGEMQADDAQHQERRRRRPGPRALDPVTGGEGRHSAGRADQHRGGHEARVPQHMGLGADGVDAHVVHDRDAGAGERAADQVEAAFAPHGGQGEAGPHADHGGDQRSNGLGRVVADPQGRLVGEHGQEMGRPDAGAGDDAGQAEPGPTLHPRRLRPTALKAEGRRGRGDADQRGDSHKAQVVLREYTGQNGEHEGRISVGEQAQLNKHGLMDSPVRRSLFRAAPPAAAARW